MICSDRWMKNRYGGPLRKLIADHFSLKYYVDMVDTPAFHAEVSAYPAITIIAKEKAGKTRLAQRPDIDQSALKRLASDMTTRPKLANTSIIEIAHIAQDSDPRVLESFDELALVRHIESQFPTLEEAGCKVGIGVATGADAVFIGPFDELDVEEDRKLPLIMTTDIQSGNGSMEGTGHSEPLPRRWDVGLIYSATLNLQRTWKVTKRRSAEDMLPSGLLRIGTGRLTVFLHRLHISPNY